MFKEEVTVDTIDISNVIGKATIVSHDSNEVEVTTTDDENIKVELVGSELKIRSKGASIKVTGGSSIKNFFGNVFGSNVVIGSNNVISGNNISIVNGKVIVDGVEVEDGNFSSKEVKIEIKVPKDMVRNINLAGQIETKVLGVSNRLRANVSGQSSLELQGTEALRVKASGQTEVEAVGVRDLTAFVSGQSEVNVEGTTLDSVMLDVSGQSEVEVRGNVDDLDASASGMSEITIRGKVNKQNTSSTGMSDIRIRG
jgi:hypothetical protein